MAKPCLSNRPLYLQLRDVLVERIATGEWKINRAIPNECDLAREYDVSPGTMRKALDLMESQHLVTRHQGRGTFVTDQGSDQLSNRFWRIRTGNGAPVTSKLEATKIIQDLASKAERERLLLGTEDFVFRIRAVRFREGRPFMVEDVSLPAALFPGLLNQSGVSHGIMVLAQQHGLLVGKGEERLTIDAACQELADDLGIAPATPVMVLDRLMVTLDETPIEWRVGRCHLAGEFYLAELR
jgi:GntR family transcriptional regulator